MGEHWGHTNAKDMKSATTRRYRTRTCGCLRCALASATDIRLRFARLNGPMARGHRFESPTFREKQKHLHKQVLCFWWTIQDSNL